MQIAMRFCVCGSFHRTDKKSQLQFTSKSHMKSHMKSHTCNQPLNVYPVRPMTRSHIHERPRIQSRGRSRRGYAESNWADPHIVLLISVEISNHLIATSYISYYIVQMRMVLSAFKAFGWLLCSRPKAKRTQNTQFDIIWQIFFLSPVQK
jgi:hypothetical protein